MPGTFTINLSKKELRAYQRHLEDLHMTASLEEQFRFEQDLARKKGRNERDIEIALKMKKMGEPLEKISEYTGLTIEEIEKL